MFGFINLHDKFINLTFFVIPGKARGRTGDCAYHIEKSWNPLVRIPAFALIHHSSFIIGHQPYGIDLGVVGLDVHVLVVGGEGKGQGVLAGG